MSATEHSGAPSNLAKDSGRRQGGNRRNAKAATKEVALGRQKDLIGGSVSQIIYQANDNPKDVISSNAILSKYADKHGVAASNVSFERPSNRTREPTRRKIDSLKIRRTQ